MLCDNLEEWDGVDGRRLKGRDMHILVTGSSCCMAEANTLQSNYPPIKNKI